MSRNHHHHSDHVHKTIHIGGVWASRHPSIVRTVLGSCVAVCLRDPVAKVGGMNHFMLPDSVGDNSASSRYGINAMELLINRCMQEGADRFRLEAKVFGGGHVLRTANSGVSVPKKNILFAFDFLETEGIRLVTQDTGGYAARSLMYYTDTGKALLKRLSETGSDTSVLDQLRRDENRKSVTTPQAELDVTLF